MMRSLFRIVHARGAIPNEMGPTHCRATPQPQEEEEEEEEEGEEEEEEFIWNLSMLITSGSAPTECVSGGLLSKSLRKAPALKRQRPAGA